MHSLEENTEEAETIRLPEGSAAPAEAVSGQKVSAAIVLATTALEALDAPGDVGELSDGNEPGDRAVPSPMPIVIDEEIYHTLPWFGDEQGDAAVPSPMPIVIGDEPGEEAVPYPTPIVIDEEIYHTLPWFGDERGEEAVPYPMPIVIDEEIYHTLPWFGDEQGDEAAPSPMPIVIDDGLWFEDLSDYPIRTGSELTPMPEVVICFPYEDMSII